MTSRPGDHRFMVTWVLAPVTACAFGVVTDWALHHDPSAGVAPPVTTAPTAPVSAARLGVLEARVASATRRFELTRLTLLAVDRRIDATTHEVRSLKKAIRRGYPPAAVAGPLPSPQVPLPAAPPAALPPPPPPPVSTTTGAS
jgi:predicted outer membrane lipoprotein